MKIKKNKNTILIVLVAIVVLAAVFYTMQPAWIMMTDKQNLTSYTEHDPNNLLTVTSSSVTTGNIKRSDSAICYLRKDFGVGNVQDFVVHMKVRLTRADPQSVIGLFLFSNSGTPGFWGGGSQTHNFYMYHYNDDGSQTTPGSTRFIYRDASYEGGTTPNERILDYSPAVSESLNKDYWFTLTRQGTDLRLYAYGNEARTTLLKEHVMTVTNDLSYRYLFIAQGSLESGNPLNADQSASAIISDITFEEYLPYAPPTAMFTWSPTTPTPGQVISFDASGSSVTQHGATFNWDFQGDSNPERIVQNAFSTTWTYTTAGTYNAKLTITDAQGASHSVTHAITVQSTTPTEYTLTVNTKTNTGTTIPSATVTVVGTGFDQTKTSSSSGTTTFTVASGSYEITVNKAGYEPWSTTTTVSSNKVVTSANVPIVNPKITCHRCSPSSGDSESQEFDGTSCPDGWYAVPPNCGPDEQSTPGFEILALLGAIGACIILIKGAKRK